MKILKKCLTAIMAASLIIGMMSGVAFSDDSIAYDEIEVEVTYFQTEARSMQEMVNDFRTGDEAWVWDETNTSKIYSGSLKTLKYDYTLEKIAMQRAAELAVSYSHTRPDGTSCFTAYEELDYRIYSAGENIAMGFTSVASMFDGWKEDDEDYSGQGHRRNMLSSGFTHIGIACVQYNGVRYWAMELAKPANPDESFVVPQDSTVSVKVRVISETTNPDITESGDCGDNLTWQLDNEGLLTISGEGLMYDYIDDSMPWYSNIESIKKVIIEDGVQNIGNFSFFGCKNLEEVDIRSELTKIGFAAFDWCGNLKSINIPESVEDIDVYAFGNCESLDNIKLPSNCSEPPMKP